MSGTEYHTVFAPPHRPGMFITTIVVSCLVGCCCYVIAYCTCVPSTASYYCTLHSILLLVDIASAQTDGY